MKEVKVHIAAALAAVVSFSGCVTGVPDFRDVVSRAESAVFPSLVYVSVVSEDTESGRDDRLQSSGSGVLISEDGELLTNHHVIDKAVKIRCQLSDGSMYSAKVVGKDKDLDVALLRLEAQDGVLFPCAKLSSRRMDVGEFVLAMGAPWGLARSVSMGIISCNDRYLDEFGEYTLWYQTDAAISPGNSGGPLVDTRGEVVGLNAAGVEAGAQAFTIPSPIIMDILPNLRAHGDARWAWLGVEWQPLRDFELDAVFDATDGVVVAGVDPQGPAAAAGLAANDRVVAIAGSPVTAMFREDLPGIRRRLGMLPCGKSVRFDFVRGGETMRADVTPRYKGDVEGREAVLKRWGFTAKEINRFETPDLAFLMPEGGVYMSAVAWDGNADNSGFRQRDVVKAIDGRPVATLGELQAVYDESMARLGETTQISVDVMRKGRPVHLILNYSVDPEKEEEL